MPRATIVGAVLVLVAGSLCGMWLGLRVAGEARHETSVATLDVSARPALRGNVTVYVPLVDWSISILRHRAPLVIDVEVNGIDRSGTRAAVSSSSRARDSLRELRSDARRTLEQAVLRALLVVAAGGLAGGAVAGAFVAALSRRRGWLAWGAAAGVGVALLVTVPSAIAFRSLADAPIDAESAGGSRRDVEELSRTLRFSEQLLHVGDDYERHYDEALRSVANLVSYTEAPTAVPDRRVLVASDIHGNVFALEAFNEFARSDTVFLTGDYAQVGARLEERITPAIANLGGRTVGVSGNHDSRRFMRTLAREGVEVLTSAGLLATEPAEGEETGADEEAPPAEDEQSEAADSGNPSTATASAPTATTGTTADAGPPADVTPPDVVLDVDGLLVAGYDDPLERQPGAGGAHVLRVYGEDYERQVAGFLAWFDGLDRRPDVVLVHQHGFAHRLLRHLAEEDDDQPLLVLTGHDHRAHVHQEGPHVIVDSGTLGAGGPFAIGEQPLAFAQVNFAGRRPVSVDIVTVEPVSGEASAERTVLARG